MQNILAHELIGLHAEVVESADPARKGIKGRIVDESKNTLDIETKNGVKKLPKKEVTLRLDLKDEKANVDCKLITERPEDRIKYCWRKYHGRM